ncbi:MAG: polymerase, partial [Bacilli bacterium]|nr:polymerase [Bacilli bacterium]
LKLLEDQKPTHVLVAFDAGKKTFRHDMFTDYKGTREKTPSELSGQFEIVKEILRALRIPFLQLENYEADDIIGTYSLRAKQANMPTTIVSGDRDMMQLISEHVDLLVMSRKGVTEVDRYDVAALNERYGLSPAQMIDLKGLMGDSADNIPGVPGVGEKTALKLLADYATLEEVLLHTDEISGKSLQSKLREHADLAVLSKELATINRDVPLAEQVDTFIRQQYEPAELLAAFKKYEFRKLIERLKLEEKVYQGVQGQTNPDVSGIPLPDAAQYEGIDTLVDALLTHLSEPESSNVSPHHQVGMYLHAVHEEGEFPIITCAALAVDGFCGYVLLQQADFDQDAEPLSGLKTLFAAQPQLVVPDAKLAQVLLNRLDIELPRGVMDPLLACYLLNPEGGVPDYREILQSRYGWVIPPLAKSSKSSDGDDQKRLRDYATAVAWGGVLLAGALTEELKDAELLSLYEQLELPVTFVLAEMESTGVRVEAQTLRELGQEFSASLAILEQEIYQLAGMEFNINSPKQMGEVLFEKLGLPADKKTKTGYSTSADVLERLAGFSPIVQKILEYRQLGKLVSTYVEGLLKVICPDGRIHTNFSQITTATGRLSSIDPNLQNIPIRLSQGRRLRQAFIPSYPQWCMLSADYSQIELRILAHISGDENMRDAFIQGIDIHTRTAAEVFGVAEEEVTSEMRRAAKAVNFGIVYGISDYGLSQNLGITRKQAGEFIENYFANFPGVKKYMESIVEQARENGYVTTLLSRRRSLPEIKSRNFNLRSFAERTAMNTPIQGSAADIMKKAMVEVHQAIQKSGLASRMLLTVHDELIFEGPAEEMDKLAELVRINMEQAVQLAVPLLVDVHVGDTWFEAK